MNQIRKGLFLDDFEAEAKIHIEKIESAFLSGNFSDNPILIDNVFRAAHSLKGTAAFFSLKKIVDVAHELESVFSHVKDRDLKINDDIIDIVLQSVDCLNDLIIHIKNDEEVDAEQLIEVLKKYSGSSKRDENALPFDFKDIEIENFLKNAERYGHKIYYVKVDSETKKQTEDIINNILSVSTFVEAVMGNESVKYYQTEAVTEKILYTFAKNKTTELLVTGVLEFELFAAAIEIDKRNIQFLHNKEIYPAVKKIKTKKVYKKISDDESDTSIRLDISVINGLMDLANEMILTRNQLFSTVSDYTKSITGLAPVLYDVSRLTTEIQEKIMFTRMQPISIIFNKFPRIIYNTAKILGKEIGVEILRDDLTLDKYILETLTDPITQIVKNAADHGLENKERRDALGKTRKGLITLNAFMRDGSAIIEVTDDGAGIDKIALKQKAIEKGIATQEEISSMSQNEIFDLIFEAGVSTSANVTNLSGRGFGMNIVKTNIEKLGGSVEIESKTNKGTTVRIKMPLILSVIRTLIVTIDNIPYAVHDSNVERMVRIDNNEKRIEIINKSLVLFLNKRIIPIITMAEIEAKVKGLKPDSAETLLEKSRSGAGIIKCLVLKADGKNFAVLIDDAVDTEQILVKPVPAFLQNCPCYSNVTVLGDGRAVMILDAEGIMRYMNLDAVEKTVVEKTIKKNKQKIILFTCSGSEHFAIDAGCVSRIETINPGAIQKVGENLFTTVWEKTFQLIRPEDFASIKKEDYNEKKLFMITFKKSKLGLLVKKVIDMTEGMFALDREQIYTDYILGTSIINEKIVIFLNHESITDCVLKTKGERNERVKFSRRRRVLRRRCNTRSKSRKKNVNHAGSHRSKRNRRHN